MSESQQNMIMKDQHVVNLFKHSLIPVSGSRSICKNRIHKEERMVEFRVSWMMDDWFRFRPIPILWLMWIDRFLNLNSSKTLHQSKGPFSSYQSCKIHSFSTTSVARNSSSMPQYKRVWFSNLDMHFGKQFEMQEDCKHEILIYANILWWLSGVGILSRKIGSSFWCGSGLPLTCELEVLSISEFCFCIHTQRAICWNDANGWIDMNSSFSQSCKIDLSLNFASIYTHTEQFVGMMQTDGYEFLCFSIVQDWSISECCFCIHTHTRLSRPILDPLLNCDTRPNDDWFHLDKRFVFRMHNPLPSTHSLFLTPPPGDLCFHASSFHARLDGPPPFDIREGLFISVDRYYGPLFPCFLTIWFPFQCRHQRPSVNKDGKDVEKYIRIDWFVKGQECPAPPLSFSPISFFCMMSDEYIMGIGGFIPC